MCTSFLGLFEVLCDIVVVLFLGIGEALDVCDGVIHAEVDFPVDVKEAEESDACLHRPLFKWYFYPLIEGEALEPIQEPVAVVLYELGVPGPEGVDLPLSPE